MPRVCINVTGKNSQPYRFSLDRKIVRLGRAADNDIIIDCPSVSSHHCEMRRVGGGYVFLHRTLLDYFADAEPSSAGPRG